MTYSLFARYRAYAQAALSLMITVTSASGADLVAEAPAPEVMVFAVGDLAQCENAAPNEAPTARVARLVDGGSAPILMVGDLAYPNGSEEDFSRCFAPLWGKFKGRMLPVPGNHEYHNPEAAPYYEYFGDQAGVAGQGYYAVHIGAWRVIGLNSNINVEAGSAQERWLKAELAVHSVRCTLAFWHHPRFSSGKHGDTPSMGIIWRDLNDAGVDVVIAGHDHDYERFAPQTASGERDDKRGIREFVVGTGGAALRLFAQFKRNSEARSSNSFGVLKLTLREESYAWEFVPVDGSGIHDHGEAMCHE